MMHRCNSDGNMVGGPCSCGFFHSQNSPFCMIFSHKAAAAAAAAVASCNEGGGGGDHMYSFASPVVDCTLSLGTPSTRFTSCHEAAEKMRRSSNFRSCSDHLFHSNQSPYTTMSRGGANANFGGGGGGAETLLARRCANCDTTSTPLWRNGPKGPKSLCNACGIRYKKEERRATAAAATGSGAIGVVDTQHMLNNSWVHHSQNQKASYITATSPYGNEFRFMQEDDTATGGGGGIPFLSWRLNVTDRPGLIHNLTT